MLTPITVLEGVGGDLGDLLMCGCLGSVMVLLFTIFGLQALDFSSFCWLIPVCCM